RDHDRIEKRQGSPAQVEGSIVRLPTGTDIHPGDHLEYRLADDELRRMVVLDAGYPHTSGSSHDEDHIYLTRVSLDRLVASQPAAPRLHPALSDAARLAEDGRILEAVREALRLVEERVQALTASERSGQALMESASGGRSPQLDITTATGGAAHDEGDGFRHLFLGAILGRGRGEDEGSRGPGNMP